MGEKAHNERNEPKRHFVGVGKLLEVGGMGNEKNDEAMKWRLSKCFELLANINSSKY